MFNAMDGEIDRRSSVGLYTLVDGIPRYIPQTYSDLCQTTKMDNFAKIVTDLNPLTIFAKNSILDIWQVAVLCFVNSFKPLTTTVPIIYKLAI